MSGKRRRKRLLYPIPTSRFRREPVSAPQSETAVISSPVVPQQIMLRPGAATVVSFPDVFSKFYVANSTVLDADAVTDHSIIVMARKEGYSEISVIKKDGDLASRLAVTVDPFGSFGSVEIHNKAKLDSQTNFRCWPRGCYYTGEITVTRACTLADRLYASNHRRRTLKLAPRRLLGGTPNLPSAVSEGHGIVPQPLKGHGRPIGTGVPSRRSR